MAAFYKQQIVYLQSQPFIKTDRRCARDKSISPPPKARSNTPPPMTIKTRARSKSPAPAPKGLTEFYLHPSHLQEIEVKDESKWVDGTDFYNKKVEQTIKYETISIFLDEPEKRLIFKVRVWSIDTEKVKQAIVESLYKYKHYITLQNISPYSYNTQRYFDSLKTAFSSNNQIHVTVSINSKMMKLLGKNLFAFYVNPERMEQIEYVMMDSFRTSIRSEKLLSDMFSIICAQYTDEANEMMQGVITTFLK